MNYVCGRSKDNGQDNEAEGKSRTKVIYLSFSSVKRCHLFSSRAALESDRGDKDVIKIELHSYHHHPVEDDVPILECLLLKIANIYHSLYPLPLRGS